MSCSNGVLLRDRNGEGEPALYSSLTLDISACPTPKGGVGVDWGGSRGFVQGTLVHLLTQFRLFRLDTRPAFWREIFCQL